MSPTDSPPPESEDLGRRLRELARSESAPDAGLARLRMRLAGSLPISAPVAETGTPAPSGTATLRKVKLLFGFGGGVLGVLVGAVAMHAVDTRVPAARETGVDAASPAPLRPLPVPTTSADAAAPPNPSADGSSAASAPPLPAPANGAAAASASGPSTIHAERLIIDEARGAYAKGERDEALSVLGRHVRAYPAGALAEEREALAVRILVDDGRYGAARERGARFRAQHPKSLMLPAVEAALESIP